MSDAAAETPPRPARSRRARIAAQRHRADRNFRIFNMLKAGVSMGQIAHQEGLSVRGARLLVERLLRSREVDPAPGFVQTQVGRLNDAMMIAHSAMMSGNLQALDRVIRLVHEFERYHGASRAQAASLATDPLPLPAGCAPRALPAPAEREQIDTTSA